MSARVDALRKARAEMIEARGRVLSLVEGKSEEELLRTPADGGWCAGEILDHLRTAETTLVKGLKKAAKGDPVRIPKRAYFYRLPIGIAFLPIKVPAPKPVRPRPRAEVRPLEVIGELAESRRALLALAEELGEDRFSRLLFPHFLLGRFTGLTWFRFLARHESRHAGQLKRVLGTGG